MTAIGIIGGGPGGYEAALTAAQLGADVVLVDSDGLGGSAVLTDCVPSKALIAVADVMGEVEDSQALGVELGQPAGVDFARVNARVKALALAQSRDVEHHLRADGVKVVRARGQLDGPRRILAVGEAGEESFDVDAVLLATGAHPRVLPDAQPDGERILTWTQLYELQELPPRLIVVGSGVTGAEFANGYQSLGSDVTLVSSRDRVLPGEDADAAGVIEDVFRRRGMTVLSKARAASVTRRQSEVTVTMTDGSSVIGSHVLLAVGSVANSADLGLDTAGVKLDERGYIVVDRVSRTTSPGVYAAGDVTGVLMLASVAAMQGRIAMRHALGDAVAPLDQGVVSSSVFTDPEIATVGWTQRKVDDGEVQAVSVKLPLARNARAKMQEINDGFVKVFCRPGSGTVMGGVVVAPRASELIHPLSVAVRNGLSAEQLADSFTVYPSLSGSVAEAARELRRAPDA